MAKQPPRRRQPQARRPMSADEQMAKLKQVKSAQIRKLDSEFSRLGAGNKKNNLPGKGNDPENFADFVNSQGNLPPQIQQEDPSVQLSGDAMQQQQFEMLARIDENLARIVEIMEEG